MVIGAAASSASSRRRCAEEEEEASLRTNARHIADASARLRAQ
jgi:hypothetical protein